MQHTLQLTQFTKIISDETRLRLLMLLVHGEELCVCQLTEVLGLSQPKISRHLAIMRTAKLIQARKSGLWVYYRLHDALPGWATETLITLQSVAHQQQPYQQDAQLMCSPEIKKLASCS